MRLFALPQEHAAEMEQIVVATCAQPRKPAVLLVGATVDDSVEESLASQGWLADPVTVRVGPVRQVPHGLAHRYIVVPDASRRLAAMSRQMRIDLQQ